MYINETKYRYGDTVPYIKWKLDDNTENEIWDAKIVAVSSIRENNVDFEGKNDLGDVITVDLSNISTATSAKSKYSIYITEDKR